MTVVLIVVRTWTPPSLGVAAPVQSLSKKQAVWASSGVVLVWLNWICSRHSLLSGRVFSSSSARHTHTSHTHTHTHTHTYTSHTPHTHTHTHTPHTHLTHTH